MIKLTEAGKLHVMEYLLHGQKTPVIERTVLHHSHVPDPQLSTNHFYMGNLLEYLQEADEIIRLFRQEIKIYDTKNRLLGSLLSEARDGGLYGDTTNR